MNYSQFPYWYNIEEFKRIKKYFAFNSKLCFFTICLDYFNLCWGVKVKKGMSKILKRAF